MSNVFEASLRLELNPSRRRLWWLLAVHASAGVPLWYLPAPWMRWIIAGAVLCSLLRELREYRADARNPPVLLWHRDGHWEISAPSEEVTAILAGAAFVQTWLVVIPLRPLDGSRPRYVAVFPDMLGADAFRRLRARLRLARFGVPQHKGDPAAFNR